MGRTISTDLKTHFGKGTTTIAICWRVERKDGTVLGYTSHDKDLISDGVTYSPAEYAEVSNMEQGADGSAGNMDINVAFGEGITKIDISKGLYDDAALFVFMLNYNDLAMGIMKLVSGNLGKISIDEYGGKFDFRSLTDRLQNKTGRLYDYRCDAALGDTRCGVTLATYTFSGTVTYVTDQSIFTDTGKTEADRYYSYGTVEFTSGLNSGWIREVKAFSSGQFSLFAPMPYEIAIGDTYSAIAGCDGFLVACKDTFDNFVNYRGCPHLPGRDEISYYPDSHS